MRGSSRRVQMAGLRVDFAMLNAAQHVELLLKTKWLPDFVIGLDFTCVL